MRLPVSRAPSPMLAASLPTYNFLHHTEAETCLSWTLTLLRGAGAFGEVAGRRAGGLCHAPVLLTWAGDSGILRLHCLLARMAGGRSAEAPAGRWHIIVLEFGSVPFPPRPLPVPFPRDFSSLPFLSVSSHSALGLISMILSLSL